MATSEDRTPAQQVFDVANSSRQIWRPQNEMIYAPRHSYPLCGCSVNALPRSS
jgi:hypothetical protein